MILGPMSDHRVATIRQVKETDHKALTLFLRDNDTRETVRHFHPFPLTAETATEIACTARSDRFYVATLNGRLVGLSMLRGWDQGFDVPSFGVIVDRSHRGLGLGRRMTEFAIEEAGRLKCRRIRLSVYASNTRAVRLYESLSFRAVHREPSIVAGEADEKIVMVRDL